MTEVEFVPLQIGRHPQARRGGREIVGRAAGVFHLARLRNGLRELTVVRIRPPVTDPGPITLELAAGALDAGGSFLLEAFVPGPDPIEPEYGESARSDDAGGPAGWAAGAGAGQKKGSKGSAGPTWEARPSLSTQASPPWRPKR